MKNNRIALKCDQTTGKTRLGKIGVSFMSAFGFFLSPYSIVGVPLDQLFFLITGVLAFLSTGIFKLPVRFKAFFFYMIFIPATITILTGYSGNILSTIFPTTLIIFTCCISTIPYSIDKKFFLRYYRLLVNIAIIFAIIQVLTHLIFNKALVFYLPLESIYGGSPYDTVPTSLERPRSFFCEPAHYVCFIMPYFCYYVGKCVESKLFSIELVWILFGLLISKSGSAMMVTAIVLLYSVYAYKMSTQKKLLIVSISIIVGIGIFGLLANTEYGSYFLERSDELSGEQEQFQSSGYVRIFRGYLIYAALPTLNKIFGTGVGEVQHIIDSNFLLTSIFATQETNRYNGFQHLLILGGIIGTFLFFRYLLHFFRYKNFSLSITILALMGFMFIESNFLNPRMLIYILMAYALVSDSNSKNTCYYTKHLIKL